MRKTFYSSITLALSILIFIFSCSEYSNKKETNIKDKIIKNEDLKYQALLEFEKSIPNNIDTSDLKNFACWNCPDGISKFCFYIGKSDYVALIKNELKTKQYSIGTFEKKENIYIFKSKMMTPLEAFYRYKKFQFYFLYKDASKVNWEKVNLENQMYETWKLVPSSEHYKEYYSNRIFLK